ncbi:GAF domain-containing protein [Acholeplasma hippikon]|uniref:Free methionine-R-sulfoxide reductase n=1 Tax=Acholeplasma hippikon TaxID=264636 RepID=A0A449BL38_9MOLU|nr:GAF domain-containing protein [Acholeplasma hippikon]VEU83186.1 Free methionine-R-sulfoxide reductase [Acholeplasma hippikon]
MNYVFLLESAKSLLQDSPNNLSLLSNASAFIKDNFDNLNWVGFYLFDGTKLTLGPFQGKVACEIIHPGRGVCGTAYVTKETQVIPDVHAIDNHIACDAASMSETVIPIMNHGEVWGVFDLDAPITNRFDEEFVDFLQKYVEILTKYIDFNKSLI